MEKVKAANVAGGFYPYRAAELSSMIDQFLQEAKSIECVPKAIIAPHAGYVYSGPVAATAYKTLIPIKDQIKNVVILSPSHCYGFTSLATIDVDFFETPLGRVAVDQKRVEEILSFGQVEIFPQAFEKEHALEVHLPFLQTVLSQFSIIPLIVGQVEPEKVEEVIAALDNDSTFFVISSDLSHFLDYDTAVKRDAKTSRCFEARDYQGLAHDDACGFYPVRGLLKWAAKRGLSIETVDLRNSGDTSGDKSRVVGYGAYLLSSSSEKTSAVKE